MKTKHWTLLLIGGIICAFGILTLSSLTGSSHRDSPIGASEPNATAPEARLVSFESAKEQALKIIRQRDSWPESPVAVCRAYWIARTNKDYAEMVVLWPNSASLDWKHISSNDPKVDYVFGKASIDGKQVPYAAKSYFERNGSYNLTMRLDLLHTDKGFRYYIISGN